MYSKKQKIKEIVVHFHLLASSERFDLDRHFYGELTLENPEIAKHYKDPEIIEMAKKFIRDKERLNDMVKKEVYLVQRIYE